MLTVEFTKDFATMKKGDTMQVDSMLASQLIRIDKVAKPFTKEEEKSAKTKKK